MNTPLRKRKRIGILIQSVSNHVRELEWQGLIKAGSALGIDVVCFTGQMLNRHDEIRGKTGMLRELASPGNLDGLIIWYGGLGLFPTQQEAAALAASFAPIPILTGEMIIPGIPCVIDDGYNGIKSAVKHMVRVHGMKKILFLRGPKGSLSSDDRYKGYMDALAENDIAFDPGLVSPPYPWEKAVAYLSDLLDARTLSPGEDFQCIISASGGLAMNMTELLKERGFDIPGDVAVCGYNNNDRERSSFPPSTTVDPHFELMGFTAFSLMCRLLDGEKIPEKNIVPGTLVIRNSCGCLYESVRTAAGPVSGAKNAEAEKPSRAAFIRHALGFFHHPRESVVEARLGGLFDALDGKTENPAEKETGFLRRLGIALGEVPPNFQYLSAWEDTITLLCEHFIPPGASPAHDRMQKMLLAARKAVCDATVISATSAIDVSMTQSVRLRQIENSLFSHLNMAEFMVLFTQKLREFGISGCYLSLVSRPPASPSRSKLIMKYRNFEIADETGAEEDFPTQDLLTDAMFSNERQTGLFVKSLSQDDACIGTVVFEIGPVKGNIYDGLADELNTAIKKIFSLKAREREIRDIETLNRDFREFASLFIHSLRHPLEQMAEAGARFVSGSAMLPHDVREDLPRIQTSIMKTEHLLADLISYTDVLMSRGECADAALSEIVKGVLAEYHAEIQEAGAIVTVNELPVIEADPRQMETLFRHLVENALKYRRKTKGLEIRIQASLQGRDSVLIVVSDNGVGIPAGQYSRIFEIFGRGNTASAQEGTGIGLAICKIIAENHHGSITVLSVPDEGSQFYIRLPISQKAIPRTFLLPR